MYYHVLFVHSWLRWVIVVSLVIVLTQAISGWIKKSDYTKFENIMSIVLIASTHLQVLIGFWLYFFLSPITTTPAPSHFMKDAVLRYWKLEHFFIMIVFLILVQAGRSMSRRKHTSLRKHKIITIFSLLGLFLLILGMPWANKPYGKPLFRSEVQNTQVSKILT